MAALLDQPKRPAHAFIVLNEHLPLHFWARTWWDPLDVVHAAGHDGVWTTWHMRTEWVREFVWIARAYGLTVR